ncbi:hypothetical protein ACFU3J_13105 [Streptomyces sp. NPDC057411]|uniref:hypothetical protein n=1 Tax=unclassified Streptomyces TaxID=2593676 RepID=UPI003631BF22
MPNTLHLSSAGRWKAIALRVAVGVGLAVAGAVGVLVWQLATEPVVTRSGQETEDALDMEETPFTAGVDYDGTPPAAWKIVLDRPLTPAEQRRLAATVHPEDARDFLTSLGGRTLRYPAAFEGRSDLAQAYFGRDATVLHMDLFSKRKAPLTITWMEVVNLSCHAPTARTVVVFPPQGGADYEGVLFDLARPGAVPIITDEGSHQGQPYFGPRRIALGDGASPGGLRVEAVTQGRSCTWEIKAKYRDAYQHFGSLTLKDGTKPFSAEAAPSRPEQLWYMDASKPDGQQWVPCHVRPEEDTCREWRETRG